jgi:GNAT superfamily N-acetyltransferase
VVAIRTASLTDRSVVAGALASAFSEDPLFGWIVGPNASLEHRMRIFFNMFLKTNLRKPDHLVFVDEEGTGAAVWQPVGKWKVPTSDLVRGLPAMLRTFRLRTPTMMSALTAIEKMHPTEPHYYLEVLGTRKDRQSKGVGSSVINAVLERADEEGVPAYLESSNPRNIPFYARHGFEVREEISCGKGAPTVTAMWREPRG